MDPRLLDYYNRELQFIREMGAEFAREYPRIAARLGMDGVECSDPYVERLLESFALLAARIQLKLDARHPDFTMSNPNRLRSLVGAFSVNQRAFHDPSGRGYRFLAPVESGPEPVEPTPFPNMVDPHLQKALWANIVELRLADNRRRQQQTMLTIAVGCMALVLVVLILTR